MWQKWVYHRSLCAGIGARYPDYSDIPRGCTDVHCGVLFNRMRHRLYAAIAGKEYGSEYENRCCEVTEIFVRIFEKSFSYGVNKHPR